MVSEEMEEMEEEEEEEEEAESDSTAARSPSPLSLVRRENGLQVLACIIEGLRTNSK